MDYKTLFNGPSTGAVWHDPDLSKMEAGCTNAATKIEPSSAQEMPCPKFILTLGYQPGSIPLLWQQQ